MLLFINKSHDINDSKLIMFSTLQFKKNPSHFRNVLIVCVPRVTCTARSFLEEEGFGGGGLVKLHPFCPGFIPIDDDLLTLEMPTFFKWELYFLYCVSLLARIYSYLYLANKKDSIVNDLGNFCGYLLFMELVAHWLLIIVASYNFIFRIIAFNYNICIFFLN